MAPRYDIGDIDRARLMVEGHSKLRPCQDEWAETFRVADRVDVIRGVLRGALARSDIKQIVQVLPYVGFHALLVRTGANWATRHPLRPLPMFRW
jgi:hypothetical protein